MSMPHSILDNTPQYMGQRFIRYGSANMSTPNVVPQKSILAAMSCSCSQQNELNYSTCRGTIENLRREPYDPARDPEDQLRMILWRRDIGSRVTHSRARRRSALYDIMAHGHWVSYGARQGEICFTVCRLTRKAQILVDVTHSKSYHDSSSLVCKSGH